MTSVPFIVAALTDEITASGREVQGQGNDDARQQCLTAARSLCYALESPLVSLLSLGCAEIPLQGVCRKSL